MNNYGTVYIGKRNSGKTTRLLDIFYRNRVEGKKILVLDSATEHGKKSLIKKIVNEDNSILIPSCSESQIFFPNCSEKDYPYELVGNNIYGLYMFDAAYYLEKGYEYPPGSLRNKQRTLYKHLCMQVIQVLVNRIDLILMDEIELLLECKSTIELIYKNNVQLVMTLHNEDGLAGLKDLFEVINV